MRARVDVSLDALAQGQQPYVSDERQGSLVLQVGLAFEFLLLGFRGQGARTSPARPRPHAPPFASLKEAGAFLDHGGNFPAHSVTMSATP